MNRREPLRRIATGRVKFAGSGLAEDEALLLASTDAVDRIGDVVERRGIDYRAWQNLGGIILFNHDAACPVANAISANIEPAGFTVKIRFAPIGTSTIADETRRLVKSGTLCGVSIGFTARSWEWLDARDPSSGIRYREIEIIEVSLVSIPANRESMVIGKRFVGSGRPAPAATLTTLSFAGDLKSREAQLRWALNNSPEAAARRQRAQEHRLWLLRHLHGVEGNG
jgi:HK97 family phage prohead protease